MGAKVGFLKTTGVFNSESGRLTFIFPNLLRLMEVTIDLCAACTFISSSCSSVSD